LKSKIAFAENEDDPDVDISLPEVLNTYIIEPQTPSRVFA